MNATLKSSRLFGTTERGLILWNTGDWRLDGMYMGRTREEARKGLAEINARRTALGLDTITLREYPGTFPDFAAEQAPKYPFVV